MRSVTSPGETGLEADELTQSVSEACRMRGKRLQPCSLEYEAAGAHDLCSFISIIGGGVVLR